MKKYVLLIIAIIFLVGCSTDNKEDEYKNQAIQETKKYISNKYNINLSDSNIEKVSLETISTGEWTTSNTGYANVIVNYDNKSFKVHVNYSKKNMEEYYDNYEQDKIIEAIKEYYYNKLGISNDNTKIYLPEDMIYSKHTHDLFRDIPTFISKINYHRDTQFLIILTKDELNQKNVESIYKEYDNFDINIYKLNKEASISTFNGNVLFQTDYNTKVYEIMNSNRYAFFIEEEYVCQNSSCYHKKYKIESLGNDIYLKSDKDYNISVKKVDQKQIKSLDDKIKECDNGELKIKDAYKVSTKVNNNKALMGVSYDIFNNNKTSEGVVSYYSTYPIIIDGDVNCRNNSSSASFISLKNDDSYIVIVEKN